MSGVPQSTVRTVSTASDSCTNARREDRFSTRKRTILLMPWGGGSGFESRRVHLLDCSAHGLGVEDELPMEIGQEFAVYLQLEQVTMVLYVVRHCQQLESGRYKIGARLVGFLDRRAQTDAAAADRVLTTLIEEKLV